MAGGVPKKDILAKIIVEMPQVVAACITYHKSRFGLATEFSADRAEQTEKELLKWAAVLNPWISFYFFMGLSHKHPEALRLPVGAFLKACADLRAKGLRLPMEEGRGLYSKQLPDNYYEPYECFSNVRFGRKPRPTVWEQGKLKLHFRSTVVSNEGAAPIRQTHLGWERRALFGIGLLAEKLCKLHGRAPNLDDANEGSHRKYQKVMREVYVRTHYWLEGRAILQWALGRPPQVWSLLSAKTRAAQENGEWWNWSLRGREEAVIKEIDRKLANEAISSVLVNIKWESDLNETAVDIFVADALNDWIHYTANCYMAKVKPSMVMKKNMQLAFEMLDNLLVSFPEHKFQLPLNLIDTDALPADLLKRFTWNDALDLLPKERMKEAAWATRIRMASHAYYTEHSISHACEVLGLLFSAYEEEALECLDRVLLERAMMLLNSLVAVTKEEGTSPPDTEPGMRAMSPMPDVLNVPPYIRQRFTEAYQFSNADQIELSRRYLSRVAHSNGTASSRSTVDPPTQDALTGSASRNREDNGGENGRDDTNGRKRKSPSVDLGDDNDGDPANNEDTPRRRAKTTDNNANGPQRKSPSVDPGDEDDRDSANNEDTPRKRANTADNNANGQNWRSPSRESDMVSTHEVENGATSPTFGEEENEPRSSALRTLQRNQRRAGANGDRERGPLAEMEANTSLDVEVEDDPERANHPYYQGEDFTTRMIVNLPPAQSEDKLPSWTVDDGYNIGQRIIPKKVSYEDITAEDIRRIGAVEMAWPGEKEASWRHGIYRCQTCQQKHLLYKDVETGELEDEHKDKEFGAECFYRTPDMRNVPYWVYKRLPPPKNTKYDGLVLPTPCNNEDGIYVVRHATASRKELKTPTYRVIWERKMAILELDAEMALTKSAKQVVQMKSLHEGSADREPDEAPKGRPTRTRALLGSRLAIHTENEALCNMEATLFGRVARNGLKKDGKAVTLRPDFFSAYALYKNDELPPYYNGPKEFMKASFKIKLLLSYLRRGGQSERVTGLSWKIIDPGYAQEVYGDGPEELIDSQESQVSVEARTLLTFYTDIEGVTKQHRILLEEVEAVLQPPTEDRTGLPHKLVMSIGQCKSVLGFLKSIAGSAEGSVVLRFEIDSVIFEAVAPGVYKIMTTEAVDYVKYESSEEGMSLMFHVRAFSVFVRLAVGLNCGLEAQWSKTSKPILLKIVSENATDVETGIECYAMMATSEAPAPLPGKARKALEPITNLETEATARPRKVMKQSEKHLDVHTNVGGVDVVSDAPAAQSPDRIARVRSWRSEVGGSHDVGDEEEAATDARQQKSVEAEEVGAVPAVPEEEDEVESVLVLHPHFEKDAFYEVAMAEGDAPRFSSTPREVRDVTVALATPPVEPEGGAGVTSIKSYEPTDGPSPHDMPMVDELVDIRMTSSGMDIQQQDAPMFSPTPKGSNFMPIFHD
ncbi:hypothetical protein CALCODRAFT_513252 [Calocera cornea HHB12733]|uniref:Uncharacterized protein n=1 Tax=Calocera cornea HHB12733 TaxID=1353952 RepID=A0A165CAW7_9BASI|nr:hypothetical protein CALCODRAFT_513252 [Calocera cornea HHB12733]